MTKRFWNLSMKLWKLGLDEAEFLSEFKKRMESTRSSYRKYASVYRAKNPGRYRMILRKSYSKHSNKRAAEARLKRFKRRQNPEAMERYRVYKRLRYLKLKNNPIFVLRSRIRTKIGMALNLSGATRSYRVLELLGCSVDEYKKYLESKFLPGMSWANYGVHGWHVDHIRPCASFNLFDSEQQKQCFHFSNTQPLWAYDNWSKGSKL